MALKYKTYSNNCLLSPSLSAHTVWLFSFLGHGVLIYTHLKCVNENFSERKMKEEAEREKKTHQWSLGSS